ncbi:MAG: ABC transporter ATP-binding protein, partial [Pseudomonadota bacterium]
LFGTATDKSFEADNLADNEIVLSVLKESQLDDDLFQMGIEVAHTTVELFGDLDPDNPFFDQLTYMDPDELPEYKTILASISNKSKEEISKKDKKMIMKLPLAYVEEQNRLGLLTDDMKNRLLEARNNLREKLLALPDSPIAFYEPDTYNSAASLQENVLLGRVSASVAEGNERVSLAIRELLNEMNLTDDVFRIGLTFNVGSGGKRLSEIQRQKLHLARALLKQPDILIVNQGLNNLGAREQGEIINMILEKSRTEGVAPKGVIWAPISPSFSELFDRVIVLNDGEIVADASPEELRNTSSVYQELLA